MPDRIDTLEGADLLAEARRRVLLEEADRSNWRAALAARAAWWRMREVGREAEFVQLRAEVRAERRRLAEHNLAAAQRLNGRDGQ